ncbi:MAG: sigma-70 family RNA polymerase sigma factor [Alphaproteobacteria bacterium]|nr:sigma-70 family RNA polymerase sigma factor [Alphaproteobacteria bacterium]
MTRGLPALIQSAQQGDRAAISELLAISQPDIRRYARSQCRSADIDDAVQDSLWLLYRRIGSLRAVGAFSVWLFAIVRRECGRLARRMFARHTAMDDIENDAALARRPAHELRLDLAAAIQSLPEHYRTVLLMRDVEELTIEEISVSLAITRQAVKARLHRARALVREFLD